MELGNMIFGNSRGNYPVDRGLQDEFCRLLEGIGFDSYGCHDFTEEWAFENDVFRIQPYYWGDCTCGFDERDEQWSRDNRHGPDCYQTELEGRLEVWDIENGYKAIENLAFGGSHDFFAGFDVAVEQSGPITAAVMTPRSDAAMEAWRKAYDQREKFTRRLYAELSAKYGLDPRFGVAVHCTCTHRVDYQSWCEANGHSDDCPTVTPNFLHKPSGFRLDWYKYPLRDSYSSEPLTRELMRSMFADCEASLTTPTKGPYNG